MADGTAALRAAAARWSLAGDQQLLDLLQTIHQRIISNCNATNAKLEEMSRGLRDASVNLQNVNNKFLALSNTQFVESRVYEDDADLTAPSVAEKEPPRLKDLASDLSKLKESLQVLESFHEPLHILRDSDSESDSDGGDDRLVLKPKDLYSDRPLPYIIGSQAWKSKWHAGLVQDDSDSDSEVSKVEEVEQYSDSEDEQTDKMDLQYPGPPASKQSTDSSSLRSESAAISVSPVRPSPSDVAAELARRLGGGTKIPEREPLYTPPEPAVRTVYKPQQPPSAAIFPDEPPPLEESSSDDDIFAELHKSRPKAQRGKAENALFGATHSLEDALFGKNPDIVVRKEQTNRQSAKSPLFDEDMDSASPQYGETPPTIPEANSESVKKPIGGISLFGTNKQGESIGAAILNRNRRKSSTSGEESNTEEVKDAKEVTEVKKERDIFDDLFAKSEKLNKKNVKSAVLPPKELIKNKDEGVKKKDVFSDIFDDIDDIFSSDIITTPVKVAKKNDKPLFDDDDDLFAEIPKSNITDKEKVKINDKPAVVSRDDSNLNNVVKEIKKESNSLFDSDSDDGLFTKPSKTNKKEVNKTEKPVEYKINDDLFGNDNDSDDIFATNENKNTVKEPMKPNAIVKTNKDTLFDSDDELFANKLNKSKPEIRKTNDAIFNDNDDNLFTTPVQKSQVSSNVNDSIRDSEKTQLQSNDNKSDYNLLAPAQPEKDSANDNLINEVCPPKNTIIEGNDELKDNSLFAPPPKSQETPDDDNSINNSDDTLFKSEEKSKALKVIESINEDVFNDGDELFRQTESSKESVVKTKNDTIDNEDLNNDINLAKKEEKPKDNIVRGIDKDVFKKSTEPTQNILKTTRIGLEVENVTQNKPSPDVFNDSDDELFKNTTKAKEKEVISVNVTVPDSPELFSAKTVKTDLFSDIFNDVPPVFEKPKEAKKSKNVNALFDDDSDDEALFFKKDDVVTDEKPNFNTSEEKFGIFYDEPPAIDVDFTQKSNKNEDIQKPVKDIAQNVDISDVSLTFDDSPIVKDNLDTTDNLTKEPKKIGKLKPMNFNINVNTLLPGASPKKKPIETIDTQTASNEDLHTTDKIEPKMVKSISFDDPEILDNKISKERAKIQVKRRPSTRRARKEAARKSAIDLTDSSFDSSNDNSTKEDVKEKVVKTVYIMDDSDIFGDASKKDATTKENTKKHLNIVDSDEERFEKSKISSKNDSTIANDSVNKKSILDSDDEDLFKTKSDKSETKIAENAQVVEKVQSVKKSFLDSDDNDDLFNISSSKVTTKISEPISNEKVTKTDETRKIEKEKSFLDSDDNEDLFSNKNTKNIVTKLVQSNLSSDEDDLFRNSAKKGIETLGKVYDNKQNVATQEKVTRTIFDDFPPIENPKTPELETVTIVPKEIKPRIEKKSTTKSILDDSSDEELFKPKTVFSKKVDEKSLFGDDGDDDDLFNPRSKKEQKRETPLPESTKETKSSEPVFVDPLSLFGDDE